MWLRKRDCGCTSTAPTVPSASWTLPLRVRTRSRGGQPARHFQPGPALSAHRGGSRRWWADVVLRVHHRADTSLSCAAPLDDALSTGTCRSRSEYRPLPPAGAQIGRDGGHRSFPDARRARVDLLYTSDAADE